MRAQGFRRIKPVDVVDGGLERQGGNRSDAGNVINRRVT
jgi:hypothetical protein